jgi:hypothetical protein
MYEDGGNLDWNALRAVPGLDFGHYEGSEPVPTYLAVPPSVRPERETCQNVRYVILVDADKRKCSGHFRTLSGFLFSVAINISSSEKPLGTNYTRVQENLILLGISQPEIYTAAIPHIPFPPGWVRSLEHREEFREWYGVRSALSISANHRSSVSGPSGILDSRTRGRMWRRATNLR